MVKVSPSILACDFANLKKEIETVDNADMLHVDVMDGHFVNNISIGVPVVSSISKATNMFLDVHLMISNPFDYIKAFSDAGADLICFHAESESNINETISLIKTYGKKVGIAIKPSTPVTVIESVIDMVDLVLVMSVEPGFGGQSFMPIALQKISQVKNIALEKNSNLLIEVDGGINFETANQCVLHGANLLVAGSYIFNAEDRQGNVFTLQNLA